MDTLRKAATCETLHVYSPACDVAIFLNRIVLLNILPLRVGSAGVGSTPGPFHRNFGVPFSPFGRVTEQVMLTEAPAGMGEGLMLISKMIYKWLCKSISSGVTITRYTEVCCCR